MPATVDVLSPGYAGDTVASSVVLIRDGDRIVVVDPGMVRDRRANILDPLAALGVTPAEVTDIVISHQHPDHTVNIALFDEIPVHDFHASYTRDEWLRRDEGDIALSDSIRLLSTPGHTVEDISTAVETADGLVVLTHVWWTADGPADDPFSPDRELLRRSRQKILDLEPALIVPGHGPAFQPSASTVL